jgi:hypothetical protein
MRRNLATLALLVLSVTPAVAQPQIGRPPGPGTPGYRPPISPYLNLGIGGTGNAAINYYGIVQPQLEQGQAIQQLQQGLLAQQGTGQGLVYGLPGTIDPVTGQPIGGATGLATTIPQAPGFFTQNRYYMSVRVAPSTGTGGGGGGGAAGVQRQPNFGIAGAR